MAYDLKATLKLEDGFSGPLRDALRMFNQLDRDVHEMNRSWQEVNSVMQQANNTMQQFGNNANSSQTDVIQLEQSVQSMSEELVDAGTAGDNLGDELNEAGNEGKRSADKLSTAFKAVAGVLATVFAVDKIKDFTQGLIESAADATAMNAQFEQVFGDIQGTATDSIMAMSKEFNMVPNRLKGPLTSMTSMFQGLGMEGEEALSTAERGVTMAADAAAFFDKSYEDANSSLNSFIKGNYEGGEAIGLFGKESQLAAYAAEELGQDWKKLDEAGKQLARMSFAEEMMKNAEITGQAARESEGYENVLNNMKQAWNDLKGVVGMPIMEVAIDAMGRLSATMGKVDGQKIADQLSAVGSYLSDTFMPLINVVSDDLKALWKAWTSMSGDSVSFINQSALDALQESMNWLADNWQAVKDGIVSLTAGFVAYKAALVGGMILGKLNFLLRLYNQGMLLTAIQTKAAAAGTWLLNAAMRANPIGLVATAIGLLVAAGVMLYRNWDTVREATGKLWDKLGAAQGVITFILGPIGLLIKSAVEIAKNWDSTKSVWENVWSGIVSATESSVNLVVESINWLIEKINLIPGVNIPIIPKVDWTGVDKFNSSDMVKEMSYAEAVAGSHANGLERIPRDGYLAELHKNEAVLTAPQSNILRGMGVLKAAGDRPIIDTGALQQEGARPSSTAPQFRQNKVYRPTKEKQAVNFTIGDVNVNGHNKPTEEIAHEIVGIVVDKLTSRIAGGALA